MHGCFHEQEAVKEKAAAVKEKEAELEEVKVTSTHIEDSHTAISRVAFEIRFLSIKHLLLLQYTNIFEYTKCSSFWIGERESCHKKRDKRGQSIQNCKRY